LSDATDTAAPTAKPARYTSRKLAFCTGLVAVATWLLTQRLIGEGTWLAIATACVSAYVLGNVGQKGVEAIATAVGAWLAGKVSP
jgi:hypothetical protein